MERVDEDWERAVAIAAHPDDLEYGLASAVARWTGQGRSVSYVLATSGEAGIDSIAPAECARLREEEERRGAAAVGVDRVDFLGLPDGLLSDGPELRRALAGALRDLRPEVVLALNHELTWGPGGPVNHRDHRIVGMAVIDAVRDAANRWVFEDLGEPWGGVRALYLAGCSEPTHVVDVSDSLEVGVASLRAHRAYIDGLGTGFDPDAFLRTNAAETGSRHGLRYAVELRRVAL